MSVELNWETLTAGPDGQELAERIRDFIHTKFQSVPLPRFIKSVTVHAFEFGSVPPELELKDITDPLPDFYEENLEAGDSDDEEDGDDDEEFHVPEELRVAAERRRRADGGGMGSGFGSGYFPAHIQIPPRGLRGPPLPDLGHQVPSPSPSPFLGVLTPGIPGGTSNMHYFHSQFASGTQTPLLAAAAVAGGHHGHLFESVHHSASSPELYHQGQYGSGVDGAGTGRGRGHGRNPSSGSILSIGDEVGTSPTAVGHTLREKHSVSTLAPTSAGTSRPPTRDAAGQDNAGDDQFGEKPVEDEEKNGKSKSRFREPRVEDVQAVFRIRYAGDVKLLLTADILLDYPMPSFVGIPLRLSITGLTFDGVGVLAHIRKRAHFCFLSPEDAVAAVGGEENQEEGTDRDRHQQGGGKMGGLLQEIRVESEIGQRESGKQSLKNVGKVERFVLEQVRRIFEEEFVYPSFWTFLV